MSEPETTILPSETGTGQLDLGVKRFYLPFSIVSRCPKCGRTVTRDLEEAYLSYPTIGAPECIHMYCCEEDANGDEQGCCHEWPVSVQIDLTMKVVG